MINPTPEEKEKLLDRFYFLQTLTYKQKAEGTKATTLTPDMFKLIGRCLLTPAKLEPLSALVIFLQQDSALNTPEVTQINRTLKEAISTNNFTREYVDPIYDANFARVTELIGNRKEELLRKAADTGNALAVAQLLKINGIDVNAKDKSGWTALMYASWKGHASVVTELLKMNDKVNGILVNAKDMNGYTALMCASINGSAYVVTELLKMNGIDVIAKSKSGWTALMWAASERHIAIVYQLCMKQLFDAPFDQGNELFQQLTNEIKSANNSMTIRPASLTKAKSSQEAQSSNNTQPILFSEAAGAPNSSSNPMANTSFKLIRSE